MKWQLAKEVLSSKIDEEIVLLAVDAESYLSLDPVGSRIWELLSEKPSTVDELADLLEAVAREIKAATRRYYRANKAR